jgi:predicted Fe-Mo cluster-binding NifX family protein
MEEIAITNWNGIVSPMFDAACCLLIVRPDGQRYSVYIRNMPLIEKVGVCSGKGVKVLICGAISNTALTMLRESDIKVLSWVRGPVEDIIDAYEKKFDIKNLFSMPGCNSKMCMRKRRHREGCGKRGVD